MGPEPMLAAFRRSMAGASLPAGSRLAVALSGGPDSMVLAALVARTLPQLSLPHVALVVDHGLRPESGAEARHVAALAASSLGLESHVLAIDWGGDPPAKAATQPAARRRRYGLLNTACKALGCNVLLTAHHADDQAETFVLRLLHGSGLHGLACMRAASVLAAEGDPGVWEEHRELEHLAWQGAVAVKQATPSPHPPGRLTLLRPLLEVGKAQLEAYAISQGLDYVIDPTNASPIYQRNRVRALLRSAPAEVGPALARLREACTLVAGEQQKSAALTLRAAALNPGEFIGTAPPKHHVRIAYYDVQTLARSEQPHAVLRLLLQRVGGASYPPASSAVDGLAARLAGGQLRGAWTGGGCVVRPVPGTKGRTMSCEPQRPSPSAGKENTVVTEN